MISARILSYVFFALAIACTAFGVIGFSINTSIGRSYNSVLMIDGGIFGLLVLVEGALLFQIKDLTSTSNAEASSLVSVSVLLMAACPAIATRTIIAAIVINFYYKAAVAVLAMDICFIFITGFTAFYVAYKQSQRIHPTDDIYPIVPSPINKYKLSIVMIVIGVVVFSIAVAMLPQHFNNFSYVSANLQAIMTFSTGILGVYAHKKSSAFVNVWHHTVAKLTAWITAVGMIGLTQSLSYYTGEQIDMPWKRADFAILTIALSVCMIISTVTNILSLQASNDVQRPSNNQELSQETNHVGLFASSILTGAIATFDIAIMNYADYGLPAFTIAAMAITVAKMGLKNQSSKDELSKYPYYVLSTFSFMGSLWAIAITIFEFVGRPDNVTIITLQSKVYGYVFMSVTFISLMPIAFFSLQAFNRARAAITTKFSDDTGITRT